MVIQKFRPDFSGHGVQVEDLCRQLAARGVRSRIISAIRGRPSETEQCDGYTVRRLRSDLVPGSAGVSSLWMPTFAVRTRSDLNGLGAELDLVHVHAQTDALYGAWSVCRRRNIPLVLEMTLLGDDDPQTVLDKRQRFAGFRERVYRDCDAYVVMSRAFLPGCAAAGLPPERLHLIPQGVETSRFRPVPPVGRAACRAALGLEPDGPVVVFVGSLIERKGLDLLLEAWPGVLEHHPDAHLWLIGRDRFDAGSAAERFVTEHLGSLDAQASDSVARLGERDDVARLLQAADLFVLPSRREGFGAVIIEAMACGLPAVVAEMPGITDFIFERPATATELSRNADGIVVPQQDAAALARTLVALADSPEVAASIGAGARRRAVERFDFERVTDDYMALYQALIDAKRTS